jgi:RimJ/RimL family protein N-acetyltransferase
MAPQPLEPPVLADSRVRVRVRGLREEDAAPFAAAFREDEDLARLVGFDPVPDEAWVRQRVAEAPAKARAGEWLQLAVAAPDDGFLGDVILQRLDWPNEKAEMGIWLVREARGTGAAAAATRLLLRWAYRAGGLHRIELE